MATLSRRRSRALLVKRPTQPFEHTKAEAIDEFAEKYEDEKIDVAGADAARHV